LAAAAAYAGACTDGPGVPRSQSFRQDVRLAREATTVEAVVPRNAPLEELLRRHDLPADLTTSLVTAVRTVFNPRQLRANRPYRITHTLGGVFRQFEYEIDATRFLRVAANALLEGKPPALEAEVVTYPTTTVTDAVGATITRERPSLIAALNEHGENLLVALELADAFGGLIDFNSDLQRDDRVEVLFDRRMRDDAIVGYEGLRAAVLINEDRRLTAIPFTLDGKTAWYDENGRSLKRAFLRSPLPFQTSISSGFSYRRLHPVTGNFRAHPAIDYRAPHGAPVVSVAAGTVEFAARSGASGNLVRVRHAGGYDTMYLHLSRFGPGIRPGTRVSQGQVIGYVGNTGVVTGTHLDFRVQKNGRWVNPLVEFGRMPPGDPIPASVMPAFMALRDQVFAELETRLSEQAAARAAAAPRTRPN
jgi:murein DD-endopeptidase MepM/ murein hydrolase activator NlpD